MKTKTFFVLTLMIVASAMIYAVEMSPGWTYGAELGLSRGDNAGSKENFAPIGRGFLQLEILNPFYLRHGVGFTPLHASKTYSTNAFLGDVRFTFHPMKEKKYSGFVFAGVGAALDLGHGRQDVVPLIPMGLGFHWRMKPGLNLETTLAYNLSNSDDLDGRPRVSGDMNTFTGKKQDGFYSLTFGLAFSDPGPKSTVPKQKEEPIIVVPVEKPVAKPVVEEKPVVDLKKVDSDGDGISDYDEINIYKTDPLKADTDGDGLSDGDEILKYKTDPLKADTDGDGLKDGEEALTYKTDPLKADTDGDGISDGDEVLKYKTDPLKPDTDGDGLNDGDEVLKYKTDPLNVDTDRDGLGDGDEVLNYKTDPLNPDTDGGSVNDGDEVAAGTDPLNPKDDVLDLSEGASFSLEGIMFETAKTTILPESAEILEKAYKALEANPDVKILIVGHTDNVGSASSNLTLSQGRADSVKKWLVDKGIAADRIRTDGKGLTEPRASNDTVEGRALNRRIEFVVE